MGTFLEERWGTKNWLIVYWVGGLAGNLLSCVASPDKVCPGVWYRLVALRNTLFGEALLATPRCQKLVQHHCLGCCVLSS